MALLDKFNQGETTLNYKGSNPSSISSDPSSTLHNEFSINGKPSLTSRPSPSRLDLNGSRPQEYSKKGPTDGRY